MLYTGLNIPFKLHTVQNSIILIKTRVKAFATMTFHVLILPSKPNLPIMGATFTSSIHVGSSASEQIKSL